MSGLGPQSCQREGSSKFRDDKHKLDGEKVASSEKEAERKTCQGEKDVQTSSRQKEGLSRFSGDKCKPDGEKVASSEKEAERKTCQAQKDVQTSRRQPERLSRFRIDKGKRDQEKVASSDKMPRARNVKDKEFQEMTPSTAVPARRPGVVPLGSPFPF